jgi:glycosyltransferase involved in cell wall biosynthesis
MRLLIVSDTFTPDINGVARTLRQLAMGLTARGHHVEVVTTCDAPPGEDGPARRVVTSLPLPGYAALRVGFASLAWFTHVFRETRAEVLYVATETPLGVAAIWAAARVGIPVVSGFHTNFHTYLRDYHLTGLQPAAEALLRTVHNHTARTLAPSRQTAQMLRGMGLANVSVLGRGVDTSLFKPDAVDSCLRASWGVGEDCPVALHVGRLAAEKNLALLEQAFAAFLEAHPQGRCVVVGDGPMADSLRARHPGWIFAGMRSGQDLARHFASGDVFIFPSTSETFGNVVIESMASGMVTVAYDYAAANEHMVSGEHGLLAPLDDEAAFLAQVREAARRWDDDGIRVSARAKALTLSWDHMFTQFEHELIQAMHGMPRLS